VEQPGNESSPGRGGPDSCIAAGAVVALKVKSKLHELDVSPRQVDGVHGD